jgi:FlaA1/EpsC-like NDP-sugar epimerase/lipopolysaccharide/colanic/teichoic acid biosynthesis glycosyltransferase
MRQTIDGALRRTLDVGTALVGCALLSPVLLLLSLLVKATSRGPVFYRARRVGRNGREFYLLKFRTMVAHADQMGPGITIDQDSRITPVGRWLRSHRLDELPQLWNVLTGDMSLVGPRPEDPRYVVHYRPEQREVLRAQPGITGPAQIAFRNEPARLRHVSNPEETYLHEIMPAKLDIDLEYLQRRTVWSDLGVLYGTLRIYVGNRILILLDLVSLALSYTLSFAIRFDNVDFLEQLGLYWPIFFPLLAIKVATFEAMGMYRRMWRYASVRDLVSVVSTVLLSSTLGGIFVLVLWVWPAATFVTGFPRSVIAIDAMLTLLLVGGVRFAARWHQEVRRPAPLQAARRAEDERRALIVGAGEAGVMAAREMLRNPQLGYQLLGFLDDDPDKQGLRIHGLPVLGTLTDLGNRVSELQVQEVLIAMPTAPGAVIRRVVELAHRAAVQVRTLPGYYELVGGRLSVQRVREVRLDDLLRRPPTPMDLDGVAAYLTGQTVLVTGAGGSIGSEICRQVARFGPERLLLLGHEENSIYHIEMELRRDFPGLRCLPVLATIRDRDKMSWLISSYEPQVIFHAAAYKHVPLLESNVDEAVLNNVVGTRHLVDAAEAASIPRLIFISSDKAVEPVSLMGASKRLGELIVQYAARRTELPYTVVRFGNVLGSDGSVVPLFQAQIAAGGPVTVTHPQVSRYFMTIPEAVQLVLQAGVLGKGGEVFILDMGDPVRIYDLACDLIHLHGLEPERDVPIVFTGLRPGEKLHEKLYTAAEQVRETSHTGILVATEAPPIPQEELSVVLDELEQLARSRRLAELRDLLLWVAVRQEVERSERA